MRAGGARPLAAPAVSGRAPHARPGLGRLALRSVFWVAISFAFWYLVRVSYLRILVAIGSLFLGWVPVEARPSGLLLERDLPDHPVYGRGFDLHVRRTLAQKGALSPQDPPALVEAQVRAEKERVRDEALGVMVLPDRPGPTPRLKGMSLHFNLIIYLSLFFAGLPGSLLRRARAALGGFPFLLIFQVLFLEYSIWDSLRAPAAPGTQSENVAFFEGRLRDVYVFLVSLVPVLIWLFHRVRLAGPSKQAAPNADSV